MYYFLAYETKNKSFCGGVFDSFPEKDKIYDFVKLYCDEGPVQATIITNEIFEKGYYLVSVDPTRYFIVVPGYPS